MELQELVGWLKKTDEFKPQREAKKKKREEAIRQACEYAGITFEDTGSLSSDDPRWIKYSRKYIELMPEDRVLPLEEGGDI